MRRAATDRSTSRDARNRCSAENSLRYDNSTAPTVPSARRRGNQKHDDDLVAHRLQRRLAGQHWPVIMPGKLTTPTTVIWFSVGIMPARTACRAGP